MGRCFYFGLDFYWLAVLRGVYFVFFSRWVVGERTSSLTCRTEFVFLEIGRVGRRVAFWGS